jgi:hypothetical protein
MSNKSSERGDGLIGGFRAFSRNMKFIYLGFWVIILWGSLSIDKSFSQQSIDVKQNQTGDWSELFPEIPGCKREIQPIKQTGEIWEQVAGYERENYKNNRGENYFGCGSITLRFEPSARKTAQKGSDFIDFPFRQWLQIKNFYAYQVSPMCGNDFWIGAATVYFDKDKILTASANMGVEKILEFARNADYELMKKSMNKLVKNKAE